MVRPIFHRLSPKRDTHRDPAHVLQVQEPHAAEAAHRPFRRRHDVESAAAEQHDQVSVRLRARDPGAAISHGTAPDEAHGGGEEAPGTFLF